MGRKHRPVINTHLPRQTKSDQRRDRDQLGRPPGAQEHMSTQPSCECPANTANWRSYLHRHGIQISLPETGIVTLLCVGSQGVSGPLLGTRPHKCLQIHSELFIYQPARKVSFQKES